MSRDQTAVFMRDECTLQTLMRVIRAGVMFPLQRPAGHAQRCMCDYSVAAAVNAQTLQSSAAQAIAIDA
jgi:hypothetical protein